MVTSKETDRHRYIISKEGEADQIGYLFPDNVLYWQKLGYEVKLSEK